MLATALLAAGCGREEEPDLVNGKKLFVGKGTCGSCHALERAGTRGTQGPDLDAAFASSRRNGLGESAIEGVVYEQIGLVRRGSIMPEDLVEGKDARDVAAYVAHVAGKPGRDTGELAAVGGASGKNKTATAKNGVLNIPADPSGALAFAAGRANAEAGQIEFVMPNPSPIQHNIAVRGPGLNRLGPVVGNGGTSRFSIALKPGTYEFFCSVPGHEPGGMKGSLTVK